MQSRVDMLRQLYLSWEIACDEVRAAEKVRNIIREDILKCCDLSDYDCKPGNPDIDAILKKEIGAEVLKDFK